MMTSYHSDVPALHHYFRSGAHERVREIVSASPEILWKANSIGWNALHVAASVGWTDDAWLLKKATANASRGTDDKSAFLTDRTHNGGHSCISLLFRRHVDPLPWHGDEVKDAALLLRGELQEVAGNPSLLHACRQLVDENMVKQENAGFRTPREQHVSVLHVMDFWQRMERWLRAASIQPEESWSLLHALAYVGGCPVQVAQLAVALNSEQARTCDEHGNLPLHLLCSCLPANEDDCQSAFLQALLTANPHAAQCVNQRGRLPLNIALSTGKRGNFVKVLIAAEPRVLMGTRDVETGLPSFALAAAAPTLNAHLHAYSTSNVGSLWHFLPPHAQQERLQQARRDLEVIQLNTIYEILRAMPDAVQLGLI